MKTYTVEQESQIGEAIAKMLCLKKDQINKRHWKTAWGSKTSLGIFNTLSRLSRDIEDGSIFKTLDLPVA